MTAQLQALRAALATVRQLEEQIETATKAVEATMTEQEQDAADEWALDPRYCACRSCWAHD